jgi:hypothetical protein
MGNPWARQGSHWARGVKWGTGRDWRNIGRVGLLRVAFDRHANQQKLENEKTLSDYLFMD